METQTIRVYVPVDITMPKEHVDMVMGEDWSDSFYKFDSLAEFGQYAARLMFFKFWDTSMTISCLTGFDGHCVEAHKEQFQAVIPCYEGWQVQDVEEWVEGVA